MSQVQIKQLSKSYSKSQPVLKNIQLEIQSGEFVVLVGPSGCGKSTLLRTIAGLEEVDHGEIWMGGQRVDSLPPAERGVAMVFQDYALYPHMTVRENLEFGLKLNRKQRLSAEQREKRIRNAAEILSLEELLHRKPAQLSGGQRQRVAIGRALVKEPKVFLFDEPLSNLDAKLRSQTRVELASLHRRLKSTSIYVTHDQVEAMTLADRLVVLNAGVIQQEGSPMELYSQPQNIFVATFLGSPGMNLLEGLINLQDDQVQFDPIDGSFPPVFLAAPQESRVVEKLSQQKKVFLGVRPESLSLSVDPGELGKAKFQVELLMIESHGHEVQLVLGFGKNRWAARAKATSFQVGDRLWAHFSAEFVHWFNAQGERI